MKILVTVKRVADPDNANKVKVSPDGSKVTSDNLQWKVNPYDEWAVETALRLNENAKTGEKLGETIVVSLGPPDAAVNVRQAIAMGADKNITDRGILVVTEDTALDSSVVARVLAKIVEKEKPDVVLLGKQSVDGESGATGEMLAELLGWPMATSAARILTEDDGKNMQIERELDTGLMKMKVTGPVVITVTDRILHPHAVKNGKTPADFAYPESAAGRFASLRGITAAKKKPIEEVPIASLGIDTAPATEYAQFTLPPARSGQTTFVANVDELVEKLRSVAKVL